MTELRRRVRMSDSLEDTRIIDPDNAEGSLGNFIARGEYWITDKNAAQVEEMLASGLCVEVDPEKPYAAGGLEIGASAGRVSGTMEVKD